MAFKISENTHYLHFDFYEPNSANAMSLDVARKLEKIQKKYKSWKKPVVVSSAHPTVFCSGGNLSDYKKLKGKPPGLKINREIQKILDQFGAWQVVKLAVVEGDVLGGGMEWLARFDFRWSTPNAFFSFWQRRIGVSSGWGGGARLAKLLGEDNVRNHMLEAELISASQAQRIGLIQHIMSSWKIRENVVEWTAQMDEDSARAMLKWTAQKEAQVFQALWLGPEHKKALERWKGKR